VNWEAVGAVAELLAAIGVIASLLYVATQIAQSTNAMRAAAHQAAITSLRDLNKNLLSHNLVEVFRTGVEDWDALNESEKARFAVLTMDMLRTFESVHNQYLMGMLDEGVWQGWQRFISDYCTAPGIQRYWDLRRDTFSPEFRELVESLEPRPKAIRFEQITSGERKTERSSTQEWYHKLS
jgi:hypothetical protein